MNKDAIKSAFESTLSQLPPGRKIHLLALLAHNITIGMRGERSNQADGYDVAEKLYALNEVQHRVTARIMNISSGKDEWREDVFVDALFGFAREGHCEEELTWAMNHTLSAA